MKKKNILIFLFLVFVKSLPAQINLSDSSEISIITAGPGTELYEAFGHSAIRIKDPILQMDIIYNYGIFDYNAPNFYVNFTKGKLLYKLARYKFKYFLTSYKKDKRWVKEQVLNLNQKQKQAYFIFLENNVRPGNETYFYDPYFNNCATKLRDITKEILDNKVHFTDKNYNQKQSFRQLMDKEIPWNTWGSFGINLALGNKLDHIADYEAAMYLPDYVYAVFKHSRVLVDGKTLNLIKKEEKLLDYKELKQNIITLNPLLVFCFILIIGVLITYFDFKKKKRTKWFDFILCFVTGIVGILIIFLWFFTDHSTTSNNYNILWAFAPNLFMSILLLNKRPKKWFKKYFVLLLILLGIIPLFWISGFQLFPLASLPLLILLFIRYLFLSLKLK